MKNTLAACLVGSVLCCGCRNDPPTSSRPAPAPSAPAEPLPASPASAVIQGRILDSVSRESVPNVNVSISSGAEVVTSADGRFSFDASVAGGGGAVTVVTDAAAHWAHRTRVVPSAEPVTIDVLPMEGEFDLEFFDHVFRDVGDAGTHRWLDEPTFEIWNRVYECTVFAEDGACDELVATNEAAPGLFVATMRDVIENDSRQYTGGTVTGSRVESSSAHPAETVVPRAQYFVDGRVTIAFVVRPDRFSWALWRFFDSGEMVAGHIQINRKHKDLRGVYSHELAHTLGFDHPLGLENVPARSIMRDDHGDGATPIDILHGRILYDRPPNSRTPDDDPGEFVLNALRAASGPHGELITRSAR